VVQNTTVNSYQYEATLFDTQYVYVPPTHDITVIGWPPQMLAGRTYTATVNFGGLAKYNQYYALSFEIAQCYDVNGDPVQVNFVAESSNVFTPHVAEVGEYGQFTRQITLTSYGAASSCLVNTTRRSESSSKNYRRPMPWLVSFVSGTSTLADPCEFLYQFQYLCVFMSCLAQRYVCSR
jgi:hypothetical protein